LVKVEVEDAPLVEDAGIDEGLGEFAPTGFRLIETEGEDLGTIEDDDAPLVEVVGTRARLRVSEAKGSCASTSTGIRREEIERTESAFDEDTCSRRVEDEGMDASIVETEGTSLVEALSACKVEGENAFTPTGLRLVEVVGLSTCNVEGLPLVVGTCLVEGTIDEDTSSPTGLLRVEVKCLCAFMVESSCLVVGIGTSAGLRVSKGEDVDTSTPTAFRRVEVESLCTCMVDGMPLVEGTSTDMDVGTGTGIVEVEGLGTARDRGRVRTTTPPSSSWGALFTPCMLLSPWLRMAVEFDMFISFRGCA
jgi:hypothetical protein